MNSDKIVPSDLVSIGKILKAHGLLGEVKVFLYNIDSESFTFLNLINLLFFVEKRTSFNNIFLKRS